jgi:ABC-2 type transport system permease protein
MRSTWLIALRELRERIKSRSFILMALFGPVSILAFTYLLFQYGGEGKQRWSVLIADPMHIMANRITLGNDRALNYTFVSDYVELEEFRDNPAYQKYDALVEINEKILMNKTAFVFYREKPTVRMQTKVQYNVERRIEEVMIEEFTALSVRKFREIKQPLNMAFRDVYDPTDEASDARGWVGYFYGGLIFLFIFLFGMTILRSVTLEKSNRIVEVLLASVSPRSLMAGKIIGIGLAAFIQFAFWLIIVGGGLYFLRLYIFPDALDASTMNVLQLANEPTQLNDWYTAREYNDFVSLIYDRVNFSTMTSYFLIFFLAGYLFYGAFFAAVGATAGSENDGQQFVIPLLILLCLALYAGYYALNFPDSWVTTLLHYLPFTSPVVVMVKLAQGYAPGQGYQLFISLIVLILSAFLTLTIAARLYKNGILQYGHRVKLRLIIRWLRKL